jgi:hypothetical protein
MTRTSKCGKIERLLLDIEGRGPSAAERALIEGHLRGCRACAGFAADRALIRDAAGRLSWPAAPARLVAETRRMLFRAPAVVRRPAIPPVWVMAVMGLVTIATGLWIGAWLPDIAPDMTLADLSAPARAALLILAQNALMLISAPAVLRSARALGGRHDSGSGPDTGLGY